MLYTHVSDINFLNATSLTRSAFHQLLRRFSRFYYIPRSTARGRPPKLRHYHQIMGLLVEAREPLFKHTFGFIDGKNLRVQQPSNADLQNAMYNGWLHTIFVTASALASRRRASLAAFSSRRR
ncbi:hypothetical protein PF004_g15239 [Phytophthora fragariae]|uniref:DDE Tnp4 domain-containing protein n=1 Tax=Phytophthora fragariae TaxID=53985 RepID=A0A6G0NLU9_9STRA|nr:hypothetical protein PF004_g15239 [Phytophthora fragariae]